MTTPQKGIEKMEHCIKSSSCCGSPGSKTLDPELDLAHRSTHNHLGQKPTPLPTSAFRTWESFFTLGVAQARLPVPGLQVGPSDPFSNLSAHLSAGGRDPMCGSTSRRPVEMSLSRIQIPSGDNKAERQQKCDGGLGSGATAAAVVRESCHRSQRHAVSS